MSSDKTIPKTTADIFFKKSMQNLVIARDFFNFNLPSSIISAIDLDTLAPAPTEYSNIALRLRLADVVYTVKRRETVTDEDDGILFLHIEQQSIPDRLMPLRMFELMVSMLKVISKQYKRSSNKPLPVVIPIILSNGRKPYPYSTRFLDLFTGLRKTRIVSAV